MKVNSVKVNKKIFPYLIILPSFLILLVFTIYPIFHAFRISFFEWGLIDTPTYIGLNNYIDMFKDFRFYRSLLNTIYYTLSVPIKMVLGFFFAYLLSRKLKGVNAVRGIFFFPRVVSLVAVGLVANWLFATHYGVNNYILDSLFGMGKIAWMANPKLAMPAIIFVSIWQNMGWFVIIYVSGIISIPVEVEEAARIDGCKQMGVIRYIILPMLKPVNTFLLIISVIYSFQVFDLVYVMTSSFRPITSSTVLVLYIYQKAFMDYKIGYASAMSVFLFILIVIVVFIQKRYLKLGKEEDN